jgi:hypothetical protein
MGIIVNKNNNRNALSIYLWLSLRHVFFSTTEFVRAATCALVLASVMCVLHISAYAQTDASSSTGNDINTKTNANNTECSTSHIASKSLDTFINMYEQNNLVGIRNRLDPAMIGFQRFIDGLQQDFARQKQIRLFIKDITLQCGPDITVISMTWEKRFLELNTFEAQLLVGRMTVLMHRSVDLWRLAAVGGESPFGTSASGTAGQIRVASTVDISSLSIISSETALAIRSLNSQKANAPFDTAAVVNLPLQIEITDADQAGRGNLQVVVETNLGDRETFSLNEIGQGRFIRNDLPFSAGAPRAGDGILQVAVGTTLTVRYADLTPGNNRPATVIERVVRTIGQPQIIDVIPNPFSFIPVLGAAPNTTVTSMPILVSGINRPTTIGIIGGAYSINGGPPSSSPGVVNNGASVSVQLQSSASQGSTNTATLSIGGVSSIFSVTTALANFTPSPFTFFPANNVAISTLVSASPITVAGISAAVPISIINGEYSINGGPFTASNGVVNNGATVVVRLTSASTFSTTTAATLTIGGVSGTFLATTVSPNVTPQPFFIPPQINVPLSSLITSQSFSIFGISAPAPISVVGGAYSINGSGFNQAPGLVQSGATISVQVTSAATPGTTTSATVTIGGVSATFLVTTAAPVNTLQPFFFVNQSGVALSALITSAPITVSGIVTPVPISIAGGAYSINGSPFTTASGMVSNGASIAVQLTSSAMFATTTSAVLTIGNQSGTFAVSTINANTNPTPFTFIAQNNVTPSRPVTSNPITVSGITAPAPISIIGGTYAINGGAFTAASGVVPNGASVVVQVLAAATPGTATSATLTIGNISAAFTVTTIVADTTPDPFSFRSILNVPPAVTETSVPVTITGINAPSPVSIAGGVYSISGGPFTSAAGIIQNGQTLTVQVVSARQTDGTGVANASVTVGGVSATFTVTTYDTVPTPFSFADASACRGGAGTVTSNPVTVSGITGPAAINVGSGGGSPAANAQYSINGGPFTSAPGIVTNGQSVTLQVARFTMTTRLIARASLDIGGVGATWSTFCP